MAPAPKRPRIEQDPSGDRMKLFQDCFDLLSKYVDGSTDEGPVIRLSTPADIVSKIDLGVKNDARTYDELIAACDEILKYSVRSSHPHFHNQLFAAVKPAAMCGEFITAVANSSMYTFEVAPVFTLMENSILEKMRGLIGMKEGDGIFCPGGSMANFYGMNLARYQKCAELGINVKEDGMYACPPFRAYVSDHGHYSITKAAAFLGLGAANVIKVKSDERGCMIPSDLDAKMSKAKESGCTPFFIQATAGTTVLGGYDDLNAICDVAEKHGAWVHVDGCWGGSFLLSSKHRSYLKGSDRVDSFAWNPHKMMGVPLQCAAFLTKRLGVLQEAHSSNAKYLFQKDKLNTNLDTGDKSVQCGRKVDILKLWMAWAATGDAGYEAHIDNIVAVSRYLRDQVFEREGFELVCEPMCTNVCFWFYPPSLRNEGAPSKGSEEYRKIVHEAAATIKARMQQKGSLMIGFQSIAIHNDPTPPNFFRMVVMSEKSTDSDMDFLLDEIAELGEDL